MISRNLWLLNLLHYWQWCSSSYFVPRVARRICRVDVAAGVLDHVWAQEGTRNKLWLIKRGRERGVRETIRVTIVPILTRRKEEPENKHKRCGKWSPFNRKSYSNNNNSNTRTSFKAFRIPTSKVFNRVVGHFKRDGHVLLQVLKI